MKKKRIDGPTSKQCGDAADILRRAAEAERADGDHDRAEVLDQAAEIMEAKAFVGGLVDLVDSGVDLSKVARALEREAKERRKKK